MLSNSVPNMLLRVPGELPEGLKLLTDEFQEGWNSVRSVDASRLERKVQARGWNFIKIGDGSMVSGVGDTSREAIAGALRHALRRISEHPNVLEIRHIDLTEYQWFFLAKVSICSYRIQQDATLPELDDAGVLPIAPSCRRLPNQLAESYSHSARSAPMLKEIMVLSKSTNGMPL